MVAQISTEKFGTTFLVSERDLADEVTSKLLANGSIVINLYILTLLFTNSGAISIFHIFNGGLLITSLFLSNYLAKKFQKNSVYLINQAVILLIPVLIDEYVTRAWISYGLLIAILVLIGATFEENSIFIATLVIAPVIQYSVAKQNLLGITDSNDILLLNSFFSTSWVIIAGIGVRLTRVFYFKYCDQIDGQLFALQDQVVDQRQKLSSLNLKDHQNLAIHGTLLNTLISYSQIPNRVSLQKNMASDLTEDLIKIRKLDIDDQEVNFEQELKELIENYGLSVEIKTKGNIFAGKENFQPLLEVIREIALNTKKHTTSTFLKIEIFNQDNSMTTTIREIFPSKVSNQILESKLLAANSSKSLARLVNAAHFDLKISNSEANDFLEYKLIIANQLQPARVLSQIGYLRKISLTRNIELLTLVSVIYSYLAIVGFFFSSVPLYVVSLVLIANLMVTYELITKARSKWRPMIAQVMLLSLIPFVTLLNESCQNLLYTPWLFNAIFGTLLYAISVINNPILKWLPGIIFTIENLVARFYFPEQCNTLLDGSTPGFIFLLVFGYLMAKLRNRNTELDSNLANSVNTEVKESKHLAEIIRKERDALLDQLPFLAQSLSKSKFTEQDLDMELKIWIQRIRSFLICSQHFNSIFVRKLYSFVLSRLDQNFSTKVSILTKSSDLTDFQPRLDFNEIQKLLLSKDSEIIISGDESLSFEVFAKEEKIFSRTSN